MALDILKSCVFYPRLRILALEQMFALQLLYVFQIKFRAKFNRKKASILPVS